MDEDQVKLLTQRWLKKRGYEVKQEVGVGGIEREVILDFYGYREVNEPEILWVECKGDQNLSELLEGFIRVEFAVHYGGGTGVLAIPTEAATKIFKYGDFLKQATGIIEILDVEKGTAHRL